MKFKINVNRKNTILDSSGNLKGLLILMASLILLISCSTAEESESLTGSTSENIKDDTSENIKGDTSKSEEKGCDEGEIYEGVGITYECINNEWILTSGGKTKDTLSIDIGEGELSNLTLTYGNETREYLLYIPVSYDGGSGVPVMLNFHGYDGTMEGQINSANMRSLADNENFILVYPQGSLIDGSSHWNASLPSADNKSSVDDLGFISALIDEIILNYKVDSNRVYATGYSNGGFMSYGLACHLSNKIAAIAGVSGTMIDIDNCTPSHKTAVMILHGTEDGVVPYNGGNGFSSVDETLAFWIEYNGTSKSPVVENFEDNGVIIEHLTYSDGKDNTSIEHYKVVGGNHVWFNFELDGLSTNQLIWNFVSQWNINGKI
jgi:polyhydroxybutyrate depolymerase